MTSQAKIMSSSRRMVRTLANRVTVDWSRPQFSCSPEVTSKFNKLKAWVSMSEATFEKYQSPPSSIDFSAAKQSVRDQELVDMLESFYVASKPPAEKYEVPTAEMHEADVKIDFLKQVDELNKEFLPVLEQEMEFQKNNRTTKDTTIFDMKVNYPLIHEEIEDELERREWFKDTGIGANK
ncbi:hypothetical protein MPSEU_000422900 [Mayamaea pseudoterrestris]|nr:hypothetical protein MPSEU_000422900 [Mayamaea pseudoterrestris]